MWRGGDGWQNVSIIIYTTIPFLFAVDRSLCLLCVCWCEICMMCVSDMYVTYISMADGFRFQVDSCQDVILTEGYSLFISVHVSISVGEPYIFWVRPTFWSADHGERKNGGDTQAWHSFRRGAFTLSDRY
jgi:hypothetical protein